MEQVAVDPFRHKEEAAMLVHNCSMRLRLWTLNTGRQSFICSDTGLVRREMEVVRCVTRR